METSQAQDDETQNPSSGPSVDGATTGAGAAATESGQRSEAEYKIGWRALAGNQSVFPLTSETSKMRAVFFAII